MIFFVPGRPRSKGSFNAVVTRDGKSRAFPVGSRALRIWVNAVIAEVSRRIADEQADVPLHPEGPVALSMHFVLEAPQHSTHGFPYRPDLDKMQRAVLDALKGLAYKDDAQVTYIRAVKSYALSQDVAGLWMEIDAAEEQQHVRSGTRG